MNRDGGSCFTSACDKAPVGRKLAAFKESPGHMSALKRGHHSRSGRALPWLLRIMEQTQHGPW